MAENTQFVEAPDRDIIAADDIAGVKFQRMKIALGADGVNDGDVSSSTPMPVAQASAGPGMGAFAKTVTTLLNAVTTNQTSSVSAFGTGRRTFQASIAGTGVVSGTVTWYGNNANSASGGAILATMSLSGTTSDTAGGDIPAEWPYVYCILTAISGTSAAVTATVGI